MINLICGTFEEFKELDINLFSLTFSEKPFFNKILLYVLETHKTFEYEVTYIEQMNEYVLSTCF